MIHGLHAWQPSALAQRQRGFSKFEFALASALFAVLTGIAADRLHGYQKSAETVAAKQLITSLQTALMLKTAHLTVAQRRGDIAALVDDNPIDWLYKKPPNYLGEYFSPNNQNLPPGNWYFDRNYKTLVYLSSERKSFISRPSILLRFKVKSSRLLTIPAAIPASAAIDNLALVQVFDCPVLALRK